MRLRRGTPGLIRDLNRSAILALIGDEGRIARVEIARRLSLSATTVTQVTRHLVDEGVIREVDQAPSSGGRPPILLGLVGEAAQAVGAKIAADHLAFVRSTLGGDVVEQWTEPFDAASGIDSLPERLAAAVDRSRPAEGRLLGLGLGVPGIVDAQGIVDAPVLGWRRLPLGPTLRKRLGIPVLADNDVNTLAVAERLYGRGRGVENFLTVTIGRGVGLGIVIGGDVYRGARGGAGEFGHVTLQPGGPTCLCGNRGCLEALVGDPALVRDARAAGLLPAGLEGGDAVARLRELADAGDPQARRLYAAAGSTLGRAVAGLVNTLSPELVLVSGEGVQAWSHIEAAFGEALSSETFPPLRDVPVEMDPWDDAKWARGAAALVLRATFATPLYERGHEDSVRARLPRSRSRRSAGRESWVGDGVRG